MNEIMFKQLSASELLRVAKDQATTALELALIDRLEETLEEAEELFGELEPCGPDR